jgi:hypothetical protein
MVSPPAGGAAATWYLGVQTRSTYYTPTVPLTWTALRKPCCGFRQRVELIAG